MAEPTPQPAPEGATSTQNGRAPPKEEVLAAPAPAKNFLLTGLHKK